MYILILKSAGLHLYTLQAQFKWNEMPNQAHAAFEPSSSDKIFHTWFIIGDVCGVMPRLSNRLHWTAIGWETSIKINSGQKHLITFETNALHITQPHNANIQLSHANRRNHLKRWLLLSFNWVLIIYMHRKKTVPNFFFSDFHDQINKLKSNVVLIRLQSPLTILYIEISQCIQIIWIFFK